MLPAMFLSHGAPTLPLTDAPAKMFLETVAARLPERPRAVLVISAHWETAQPRVNAVAVNDTIHDFYGFPRALHEMTYPAPGSPELAARVSALLTAAGLPCGIDTARGLDHGAWVPLKLIYPQAAISVVQLSVQSGLGPAHHLAMGRALTNLREEGVLIVGSGSLTHDLSSFGAYRDRISAPEPAWVTAFADWFDSALSRDATDELVAYRRLAPFATKNHPSEEYLLPLFVALGAGGEAPHVEHWHASATYGILRMDVYAFGSGR
ncbi:MAG: Dioxygenase [Hyphomicrobiales bacterium]|nr:Dioxygenase [Hyphomicrobiales bacterium]